LPHSKNLAGHYWDLGGFHKWYIKSPLPPFLSQEGRHRVRVIFFCYLKKLSSSPNPSQRERVFRANIKTYSRNMALNRGIVSKWNEIFGFLNSSH
jgi:hypothetical protein